MENKFSGKKVLDTFFAAQKTLKVTLEIISPFECFFSYLPHKKKAKGGCCLSSLIYFKSNPSHHLSGQLRLFGY